MRSITLRAFGAFLALVLVFQFSDVHAEELAEKQIIHTSNGSEPRELDPRKITGVPETHIVSNIFEGLTEIDQVTLKPYPGVAKSWEISEDGKTYTFHLRKEAKWSDGKPVTANDFVYSWKSVLEPAFAAEYAYQLHYIKNAKDFNEGKIKDFSQVGVKALDDYTLKVELESPTPFFLFLTAFETLRPVAKHVVEKFEGLEWTKPENFVGNGPFVVSEWKLNAHIKLTPNPHYWDKENVKTSEVWIYPVENQETEERMFFAGKIHLAYEVPDLKIPLYKKQIAENPGKYHPYHEVPYLGSYFYRFNTTRKPFNDKRVRKAFALAIDRTLVTDRVTRAGEMPSYSFTPPGIAGYEPNKYVPQQATAEALNKAKALLAEAGYPDGKDFPKVEILFNTSDNHRRIALALQQMIKKNLGVEVGLYNQEWKVYLNSEKKLDYDLSRAGWIGDYADPNTFLDLFVTDGGNNRTGWGNKEYDALIAQAGTERDHAKRLEIFHKAEALLMEEMPILPIYIYTNQYLASPKLKTRTLDGKIIDYNSNVMDRWAFKQWVLVK